MSRRFFAGVIRWMLAFGGRRDEAAFPPYLAGIKGRHLIAARFVRTNWIPADPMPG
jgi:hypothetical protein